MEDIAPDAAAEPVVEAPAKPRSESPLVALIDRWWEDHFPGSPVARVTEAWNHAYTAKEELKRRAAAL